MKILNDENKSVTEKVKQAINDLVDVKKMIENLE
jgi:hypothetical protein